MAKPQSMINIAGAAIAAGKPLPTPTDATRPQGDPDLASLLADSDATTTAAADRDDIEATAHPNTKHANRFWRLFCLETLEANPRACISLTAADARVYERKRGNVKQADTKKLADVFLENRDPLTGRGAGIYTRASFKAVQEVGRPAVLEFAFMGSGAAGQSAIATQDETAKEERRALYRHMKAFFKAYLKSNPAAVRAANWNDEDVLEGVNLSTAPTPAEAAQ